MAATIKNVAVVGAGGNLGPFIVQTLLSSNFNTTVLARSSSQSTFPSSVRVVKGDYSPEFLASALKGIDAIVMTISTFAVEQQNMIVEAAAKAGVKRLIPSEFGSDTTNPIIQQVTPFYQNKINAVKHIEKVVAGHPDMTWTALVTGPFHDFCLKYGMYGFDLANKKATLYDHGAAKFEATTLSTVGSAIASILSKPEKYQNQYLYISSFTTSQAEILAALKKASGTNDWAVEEKSAKVWEDEARAKEQKGDVAGTYELIFATMFQEGKGGEFAGKGLENAALGLPDEDLETVTKEVFEGDRHVVKW